MCQQTRGSQHKSVGFVQRLCLLLLRVIHAMEMHFSEHCLVLVIVFLDVNRKQSQPCVSSKRQCAFPRHDWVFYGMSRPFRNTLLRRDVDHLTTLRFTHSGESHLQRLIQFHQPLQQLFSIIAFLLFCAHSQHSRTLYHLKSSGARRESLARRSRFAFLVPCPARRWLPRPM